MRSKRSPLPRVRRCRTVFYLVLRLALQKIIQRIRLENPTAIHGREFGSKSFNLVIIERNIPIVCNNLVIGIRESFRSSVKALNDDKAGRLAIEYRDVKIGPKIAQYRQEFPHVAGSTSDA